MMQQHVMSIACLNNALRGTWAAIPRLNGVISPSMRPNDLVFKSNGDLYFTDPPYGLEKNWDDPARELDWKKRRHQGHRGPKERGPKLEVVRRRR